MKYFINESIGLSTAPEGPLISQLDGFAGFLTAKGYSWSTIHRKVLRAACFGQWLKQREIGLCGLTSDHPDRYLSDRARCLRPSDGDVAALRHLMGYLRLKGVISADKALVRPMTAVDRCVQAYTLHLRDMRGLATTTVDGYTPFVLRFLRHLRFRCRRPSVMRLPTICATEGPGATADACFSVPGRPTADSSMAGVLDPLFATRSAVPASMHRTVAPISSAMVLPPR